MINSSNQTLELPKLALSYYHIEKTPKHAKNMNKTLTRYPLGDMFHLNTL